MTRTLLILKWVGLVILALVFYAGFLCIMYEVGMLIGTLIYG